MPSEPALRSGVAPVHRHERQVHGRLPGSFWTDPESEASPLVSTEHHCQTDLQIGHQLSAIRSRPRQKQRDVSHPSKQV